MVYFIEAKATGLIKIGFTSDVKSRLSSICAASGVAVTLLVTTPGQRDVESAYHERFSKSREHGEWFRATADILAEVARLKAGAQ